MRVWGKGVCWNVSAVLLWKTLNAIGSRLAVPRVLRTGVARVGNVRDRP